MPDASTCARSVQLRYADRPGTSSQKLIGVRVRATAVATRIPDAMRVRIAQWQAPGHT